MTCQNALRPLTAALTLAALLALPARGLAADSFYVVKITEMDKKVDFKLMSAEDYKALETEVKAETSLFPKAEELAKKEWKTADEKGPFPGRLSPRKVEVIERHTVREKADEKLEKLQASEDKKSGDTRKPGGKMNEAEKKMAESKAEKEKDLQKAHDLVKGKLTELVSAAKDKDAKAKEGEKKPDEKP
jgi:hypothetical protein